MRLLLLKHLEVREDAVLGTVVCECSLRQRPTLTVYLPRCALLLKDNLKATNCVVHHLAREDVHLHHVASGDECDAPLLQELLWDLILDVGVRVWNSDHLSGALNCTCAITTS